MSGEAKGYLPLPCVLTWPLGMNSAFSAPFTSMGSACAWNEGVVSVTSGTTQEGVALFESNMLIHLNHGEYNTIEYSLQFDEPAYGRESMVGMGTTERGAFFGYRDLEFGHKVVIGGSREYAQIFIGGAPASSGSISISLGGRTASVDVAYGMTVGQVMASIVYSPALAALNIRACVTCDRVEIFTVEAKGYPDAPPSIDFGATGVTGSMVLSKAGCEPMTQWTPLSAFNLNLAILQQVDFSRWNVFRLKFHMWSAGGIELAILNPRSAEFVNVLEWRPSGTERFDTTVPYCTSVNVYTTGSEVSSSGGVRVVGGAVMTGIPNTAGLRGRYCRTFVKRSVATSAAGDSAVGILCAPLVHDGGVRNTGIGTLYRLSVSVQASVDVLCAVIISGVQTDPFPCSRPLPWTCLMTADVSGFNTVYAGMNCASAFIAAGDSTSVDMEVDQSWLTPGSYMALCVRCAHPEDIGAVIDCVSYSCAWYET